MPHFWQVPDFGDCTSGCIGHAKIPLWIPSHPAMMSATMAMVNVGHLNWIASL